MPYKREISRLTWQLEEARRTQEHFEKNLGPEKKLATLLHERGCKKSHENQCSWLREELFPDTWSDTRSTHCGYMSKAKQILAVADYETAVKIIDILYP